MPDRAAPEQQHVDQIVDFFQTLFARVFSHPFERGIHDRFRRNAVLRQVQEAADAASQSLIRFFSSQRLDTRQVSVYLAGLDAALGSLELAQVASPGTSPETIVQALLDEHPLPRGIKKRGAQAAYRVGLHLAVQVLCQVGPVMAEWKRLRFSSTFELPRRIVLTLNKISRVLGDWASAGQEAADERFELTYRDYLLQRFNRVEAGTVRMTTSLDVDLRELFVMPQVAAAAQDPDEELAPADGTLLQRLRHAKSRTGRGWKEDGSEPESPRPGPPGRSALDQVCQTPRTLITGSPGSGKSTFLEWLQLRLAAGEVEMVLAERQAIPVLLRIRQLDPADLPRGAALIERATASRDRAALMPAGWIDRQMRAGRVVLLIDGLDETDPEIRESRIVPWLKELCGRFPRCRYVVASRPAGLPGDGLTDLGFEPCVLFDFRPAEVAAFARNWCTAIRLARNEPEEEARTEGARDGAQIVESFQSHPQIQNLARNPLMLSAICLVSYFEGGRLPNDRVRLYRLCVEGLLHHWDQRRGIRSELSLDEKLRACREVALAMQNQDRAESLEAEICATFQAVLGDGERARGLLRQIRSRSGLLVERRPNVFAFAHLTFQAFLAAQAVDQGNLLGLDARKLVEELDASKWHEVIALYSGQTTAKSAKALVRNLLRSRPSLDLGEVLADAFLAAGPEVTADRGLERRVVKRVAELPGPRGTSTLRERFPADLVLPIAVRSVGSVHNDLAASGAYRFLKESPRELDLSPLAKRLARWPELTPYQRAELLHLLVLRGAEGLLAAAADRELLVSAGPQFGREGRYQCQAEIALIGLAGRRSSHLGSPGFDSVWQAVLEALLRFPHLPSLERPAAAARLERILFADGGPDRPLPHVPGDRSQLEGLTSRLTRNLRYPPVRRVLLRWLAGLRLGAGATPPSRGFGESHGGANRP